MWINNWKIVVATSLNFLFFKASKVIISLYIVAVKSFVVNYTCKLNYLQYLGWLPIAKCKVLLNKTIITVIEYCVKKLRLVVKKKLSTIWCCI